jgi:hypothetical protein
MEPRTATLMPIATWPVIVQPTQFPHGELVEPRTAALPSGKSAPSDKNNHGCLSTSLKPELSCSRPFHGELLPEPFESGEGRRVSGRATDPSAGPPVRLRRSICAFQADIASIVDANANRADTAPTATMGPDSRRSSTRPSEQAEAGRQGENVSGRSSDRIIYLPRRASTTARLPTMQNNGQTLMRAWQRESTPGSLT